MGLTRTQPDIKVLQIQLTGFLDKDTPKFCKELWSLCLSAQSNAQGVPKELLEAKKLELIQEKVVDNYMVTWTSVLISPLRLRLKRRLRKPNVVKSRKNYENGTLTISDKGNGVNEVEEEGEAVEVDLILIVVHHDTRDLHRLDVVTPQIIVRHHQDERLIHIFPEVEGDVVLTTEDVVHRPRLVLHLPPVPVLAP